MKPATSTAHNNFPTVSIGFFNDTATTEIYTLSLHDALPICLVLGSGYACIALGWTILLGVAHKTDRKSTRLNSSHLVSSYAVFCLQNTTRRGGPDRLATRGGAGAGPRAAGRVS